MASPSQSWVTAQGHQTLTDRWWGPRAGRRVSRRCHQADVRGERVSELGELTALSDTRSLLDGLRASWRVHLRRPPVTPRGQLSLVMGLPPGGWRLGHRHCCHLASILSLNKNRAFRRTGVGSLDSTPLFLVAAITLRVGGGGTRSLPGTPLLRADAEIGGLMPSFQRCPLPPASRMPISVHKS